MTGRFNAFREAVPAAIAAVMPQLRTCEAQFGRFDLDELEHASIRTPAVRVGILRAPLDPRADDSSTAQLSCAAFAVTDGRKRDDAAWTIGEAVAVLLRRNQRFGLDNIGAPQQIRVGPVLSNAIDRKGVSIVAVEWTQALHRIGDSLFDPAGVVSADLYIDGDPVDYPEEDPAS